jgi:hypothetical protein
MQAMFMKRPFSGVATTHSPHVSPRDGDHLQDGKFSLTGPRRFVWIRTDTSVGGRDHGSAVQGRGTGDDRNDIRK